MISLLMGSLLLGAAAGIIEAIPIWKSKDKKVKAKEKNDLILLCIVNRGLIGLFVATAKIVTCCSIGNGALIGLLISLSVAMQLKRYPQVLIPGLVEGGVIAYLVGAFLK